MFLKDYDYSLPEKYIAQHPNDKRDESKLLDYNRHNNEITHLEFSQIVNIFNDNDVLVVNNSKVMKSRLFGETDKQHKVEVLLVNKLENHKWDCIIYPGKKFKIGTELFFENNITGNVIEKSDLGRIIKFNKDLINDLLKIGNMPLPPYIKEFTGDTKRYQTVYSKELGSCAAPTAGLHFTQQLLDKVKSKIPVIELTLHVGPGTFQPLKNDNVLDNKLHKEYYSIKDNDYEKLVKFKKQKKNIIAVGTTSVRTLETIFKNTNDPVLEGWTDIFIYPGYEFKCVDYLVTNFHIPKSSLMLLVAAFVGRKKLLELYNIAMEKDYRFYSFGDAMFIR